MDSVGKHTESIIEEEHGDEDDKGDDRELYARPDLEMTSVAGIMIFA